MHTTTLRKVGGSIMLAVPPALLDILRLRPGAKVGMAVERGRLVVEPQKRPRYTLAELLASLPEEERIILTLHYMKSMSCAEIALILRVPERSVNQVIISGRARLTMGLNL